MTMPAKSRNDLPQGSGDEDEESDDNVPLSNLLTSAHELAAREKDAEFLNVVPSLFKSS